MTELNRALLTELKLALEKELTPIRADMHSVKLELANWKAGILGRDEFERRIEALKTKLERACMDSDKSQTRLEERLRQQEQQQAADRATMKAWAGTAALLSSALSSLAVWMVIRTLGG